MHRYVQLSEAEVEEYEDKHGLTRDIGMKYRDRSKNAIFYEFRINCCDAFMEKMDKDSEFGGNKSVLFQKIKVSKTNTQQYIAAGSYQRMRVMILAMLYIMMQPLVVMMSRITLVF